MTEEEKNKKLYFKLYPPIAPVFHPEDKVDPEDRGPLHRLQIIRTDADPVKGLDESAMLMEHRRSPIGKWDLIMYVPVKPEATVDMMTGLYDERIIFTEDFHNVPYSYKNKRDMFGLDEYDNISEEDRLVFRSDKWDGHLMHQLDACWSEQKGMLRLYDPCKPDESIGYYELGEISGMFADAESRECPSIIMDTRGMPERVKDMIAHPEQHQEEWKDVGLNLSSDNRKE